MLRMIIMAILLTGMSLYGKGVLASETAGDFPRASIEIKGAEVKPSLAISQRRIEVDKELDEALKWLEEKERAALLERIQDDIREWVIQKRIERETSQNK